MANVAKDFAQLISQSKSNKTGPYDTQATVKRVEGNTVWVSIPGGVDETPIDKTVNCTAGDKVQVRVSGGRAWITGNASAPPTDDKTANEAKGVAANAKETADAVEGIAQAAQHSADTAATAAETAKTNAQTAITNAGLAQTAASEAKAQAKNAGEYASRALGNLSTVQSVAETLTWITAHGTMTLTTDVTPDPTHVYFVVDPAGDYTVGGVTYAIVTEPVTADMGTYYELSIDESLNNYVGTHLALTQEGLWLLPASTGTNKVLIATGAGSTYTTAGTYIIDSGGAVVASFRANGATIGETTDGNSRSEIGTAGMQIYQKVSGNDVIIAHLGYGAGWNGSGTANAPFYTLGNRNVLVIQTYSASVAYQKGEIVRVGGTEYLRIRNGAAGIDVTNTDYWVVMQWPQNGSYSVSQGYGGIANGPSSQAIGKYSIALGSGAVAAGGTQTTVTRGGVSYPTEMPIAVGDMSCAMNSAVAEAQLSFAENVSRAKGNWSHSEGISTTIGDFSHAEGEGTQANGDNSHSQNYYTIAGSDNQTALGKWNIADNASTYAVIIGNGTSASARSNALTVDWSGNVKAAGSLTINNHSSAIGTVKQSYASAKSVASGTNTNLTSISLEAGTWVVTGGVRFPSNATGYRRMNISKTNAANAADVQLPPANGASTQLAYTVVVTPTATTTYYLNCYHNAGTSLNLVAGGSENGINFLRAVRIA